MSPGADLGALALSFSPGGMDGAPIAGQRLSSTDTVYIYFKPAASIDLAVWRIDGVEINTDRWAPYDLTADSFTPVDLSSLSPGRHVVSVMAIDGDNVDIDVGEFFVDDATTPSSTPPDPNPNQLAPVTGGLFVYLGGAAIPLDGVTMAASSAVEIGYSGDEPIDKAVMWLTSGLSDFGTYFDESDPYRIQQTLPAGQYTLKAVVLKAGRFGTEEADFTVSG